MRLAMERLGRGTSESPTARSAGTPENLENLFWRILDEYTMALIVAAVCFTYMVPGGALVSYLLAVGVITTISSDDTDVV